MIPDTVTSIPIRKIRRSPQKSSLEVRSGNKSNGLRSPLSSACSISIEIRLIQSKQKHIRLSVLHFDCKKRIRLNASAFLVEGCNLEGIWMNRKLSKSLTSNLFSLSTHLNTKLSYSRKKLFIALVTSNLLRNSLLKVEKNVKFSRYKQKLRDIYSLCRDFVDCRLMDAIVNSPNESFVLLF